MTERLRRESYSNAGYISGKMANDFGISPRKTMLILVIVVGCFAVLWPKVFYPMLVGSANRHIKPSPIDRTKGCCDVISETDVRTLKIMSEICSTIVKKEEEDSPLTGRELVAKCRSDVLDTCGIDLSSVLQQQVRLGHTTKQILDEVRSLNGSLCLKYNFGVSPWSLGVPHRVTVKMSPSYSIRQERPPHLRSEMVHPAFQERGRAIPQVQPTQKPSTPSRLIQKVVPGRPGPLPGMRPTIGGAGHVVPSPKQGAGSMGLIMPIYTIGIVIFFTYTVLKIMFKKQPEELYPSVEPDPNFRTHVFEPERLYKAPEIPKDGSSTKLGDAELDQLRRRLRETEMAMERIVEQMAKVPFDLKDVVANGGVLNQDDDQASVKVVGMETTASCEGGRRWSRPESPVLPATHPPVSEPVEPPQEIFLEGSLPPQSHLLVTDSATETQNMNSEEDPAVVLAGKMTLSVISLDSSENGTDESSNSGRKFDERSSSNVSEEFEKIEIDPQLEEQIDDIIEKARNIGLDQSLLDEIRKELNEEEETVETAEDVEELGQTDVKSDEGVTEDKIPLTKEHQSEVLNQASELIDNLEKEIVQGDATGKQLEDENQQNGVGKVDESEESLVCSGVIAANEGDALKEGGATVQSPAFEEVLQLEEQECDLHGKDEDIVTVDPEVQTIPEQITTENSLQKINGFNQAEIEDKTVVDNVESILANEENQSVKKLDVDSGHQVAAEEVEAATDKKLEELLVGLTSTEGKDTIEKLLKSVERDEAVIEPEIVQKEEKALIGLPSNESNDTAENPEAVGKVEEPLEKLASGDKDGSKEIATRSETEIAEEKVETVGEPMKVENQKEPILETVPKEENGTAEGLVGSEAEVTEEVANAETDEEQEGDEEGEEIEYEYEESDEEVDEEIRNAERMDNGADVGNVQRMNGGVHGESKNGGRGADVAENELSDEENSEDQNAEDDDDEVEEIIEYVTDEEEEEIEIVEPTQRNNINHVNEHSTNE